MSRGSRCRGARSSVAAIACYLTGFFSAAWAQEAEQVQVVVDAVVQSVESDFDCRVDVYGDPRLDQLLNRWFVTYSVTGDGCDQAAEALLQRGAESAVNFARMPNDKEIGALAQNIVWSVESTFGCRITLTGEPRLNEAAGRWSVGALTAGPNCEGAADELRRRGRERGVSFNAMRRDRSPLTR